MRAIAACLVSSLFLAFVPSAASAQVTPREVTMDEYRMVEPGMSRTRVERIFGIGKGCEYTSYTIDGVLFTGRQYRNTEGNMVSVRYRQREGSPARVRAKQWNTVKSC